jgi:MFS superfamily sulfate permease-like transporter
MNSKVVVGVTVGLVVGAIATGLYMYVMVRSEREYSTKLANSLVSQAEQSIGKGSLSDLASFTDAKLAPAADSTTETLHNEIVGLLKTIFVQTRLVEDLEQKNQVTQPHSLLIYAVPRMITPGDLSKIENQLGLLGYKNVEHTKQTIAAQTGIDYTTNITISADVNDEGRFLMRVLVY